MSAYVDGHGTIHRDGAPRSSGARGRGPGALALCVAVAAAAVAAQTVPTLPELKDHRARRDGSYLYPSVEWHRHLGLAAFAKTGGRTHVGAFGRWVAPSDFAPSDLAPRDVADRLSAMDDPQLLVLLVGAIFAAHALFPRSQLLARHFSASAAAVRAGRVWTVLLAALAHDDLLHAAFNGLALSRCGPTLAARFSHDRQQSWCFVVLAAVASSSASIWTQAFTETRGSSGIIFAMLAHEAARDPSAPTLLYGVVEMPAGTALVAALAIDVLVRRRGGIDYAAHAGGALFGLCYFEVLRRSCESSPWRRWLGRC